MSNEQQVDLIGQKIKKAKGTIFGDFESACREHMSNNGLPLPYDVQFVADTHIKRYSADSKKYKKDEWYVGYPHENALVVVYGSFSSQEQYTFKSYDDSLDDLDTRIARRLQLEEDRKKTNEFLATSAAEAALRAQDEWKKALKEPKGSHLSYPNAKGINPIGVKFVDKEGSTTIIVPIQDIDDHIITLQYIFYSTQEGKYAKRFMQFGATKGNFHVISNEVIKDGNVVFLCEGWATGVSIYEAVHNNKTHVVAAMSKGNIENVLAILMAKYKGCEFIIAGDDDKYREDIKLLAKKYGVKAVFPKCSQGKDFNDLHQYDGIAMVKEQLARASLIETNDLAPSACYKERITPASLDSLINPNTNIESVLNIKELLQRHKAQLASYRGKEFLGLPQITLCELDKALLGLRKLMVLCAAPNTGKTSLTIQFGIDILLHNSDSCLLFISIEMVADDILTGMQCYLSGLKDREILLGGRHDKETGQWECLANDELAKIEDANTRLEEFGNRLRILDGETYPDITIDQIIEHVEDIKQKTGLKHVAVIIDYLQVFPVPSKQIDQFKSSLDQDKWLIGQMKRIRNHINKDTEKQVPLIVITEARKPGSSSANQKPNMSDIMGSARTSYTPDCLLFIWPLDKDELVDLWDKNIGRQFNPKDDIHKEAVWEYFTANEWAVSLLVANKGRNGMRRVSIPVVFHYSENRFTTFDSEKNGILEAVKNLDIIQPMEKKKERKNDNAACKDSKNYAAHDDTIDEIDKI